MKFMSFMNSARALFTGEKSTTATTVHEQQPQQ